MKKEDIPFYKYLCKGWVKYVVVIVAAFVLTFVTGTNNLKVWVQTCRTLRDQKERVESLENEIKDNESRIRQLTSEKDSLEKFAREHYLFHEEGEDVYVVSR